MSRTRSLNTASAARRRWRWPRWPAPRWWPSRCRRWPKPTRSRRLRPAPPPLRQHVLQGPPADPNAPPPAPGDPAAPAPADPNAPAACRRRSQRPAACCRRSQRGTSPARAGARPSRQRRGRVQLRGARRLEGLRRQAVVLRPGAADQRASPRHRAPTQPRQQGAAQPPNDTSVLLGRLDMKLFAGAEADNAKAATRLASDMGEFFMPFPGTRVNQESGPLDCGRHARRLLVVRGEVHRHQQAERVRSGRAWSATRRRRWHPASHGSARPAQRALVRGLARHREQSGGQGRRRHARQVHSAVDSAARHQSRTRTRPAAIPTRPPRIRMHRRTAARTGRHRSASVSRSTRPARRG